jgi:hypothetical protein
MDKRSLISESVMMIQIGVHLAREEPNRHIIHVAPGVSRMTNTRKVPTKSNLGPCSRDEVLASSDSLARPSSWAASFSLQQTTSKQGGMIWQTSYWATRFTWPHKPNMQSLQIEACHRGQNDVVLNRYRRGLPPWNSHDPIPTLPFRVIHFPLFDPPDHIHKHEHKLLLIKSKLSF